jgi:hypothetical protein
MKVLSACLLSFVLLGCGNYNNSSSQSSNVAGNWTITATSTKFGDMITATGMLTQSTYAISGSFNLVGDPCANTASVSGTITGASISLVLNEAGQDVTFTGTLTNGGSSASGTYTAVAGGCTSGDTGTWTGMMK